MSPLTRRRIQLWLAWSSANGLSVGSLVWLLITLDRSSFLKGGLTAIALILSVGFIAGVQQVLLRSLGWAVRWWWLASYLGIVLGVLVGAIVPVGSLLSIFAVGAALAVVQMRSCEPLRKWPVLWPIASGVGVTAGAMQFLLATSSPGVMNDPLWAYFTGLAGGACYGIFTGLGLVVYIKEPTTADPAAISL